MRILFNIALAISILFFPWWVVAPLMITACAFVPRMYEAVLYGIAFDALYATSFGIHGFAFFGSAFSAMTLAATFFLRSRLSL
jgi:cell shape-determining protein MreD